MEGLRFRRLANEQECLRLTAEWEPGESMIGPAIACQRIALCASPFFPSPLHPRSRHHPWKTMEIGKKIPLFDYAENYRNFASMPSFVCIHDTHTIQNSLFHYINSSNEINKSIISLVITTKYMCFFPLKA